MANFSRAYFITKGSGSAGDVLDYFTAEDAVFPQGSAAFSQGLNNHPLIVYPNFTTAFVDFPGVVYPSGIVRVHLFWAATVLVLGDVNWMVSWERDDPSTLFVPGVNLTLDSFAASKSQADLAPVVFGRLHETEIIFTPLEMDSVIVGNPYRLRVRRQGGIPPDTLDGDALLFRVSVTGL